MSLPVNIALGVVGGGAVAVGGCGVYSVATGKPVLFFGRTTKTLDSQSGLEAQNGANSGNQASDSEDAATTTVNTGSDDSAQTSTQKEITDLIEKVKKGCTVKVWVSDSSDGRDLAPSTETNPSGLIAALKSIGSDCETNREESSKKHKFLKQADTQWSVMKEKDQISELTKEWSEKCVVKVRIDGSNKDISDSTVTDEKLEGFYSVIKGKVSDCGKSVEKPSAPKEFVYKKDGTWKEMTEHDQIKELATSWESKCILKVHLSGSTKDLKTITTSDSIAGLYKKIEEKKNDCTKDSSGSAKTIIFKQQESSWVPMTEKEKLQDLMKGTESKCTLKIRTTSANTNTDTELKNYSSDLTGLYEVLKTSKEDECGSKQTTLKDLIYQQKQTGGTWEKVSS